MKERGLLSCSLGLPCGTVCLLISHLASLLSSQSLSTFCVSPVWALPFQWNHLWASHLTSLFPSSSPVTPASLCSLHLLETICDSVFIHSLTFIKSILCTWTYARALGIRKMRRPRLSSESPKTPWGEQVAGQVITIPIPYDKSCCSLTQNSSAF